MIRLHYTYFTPCSKYRFRAALSYKENLISDHYTTVSDYYAADDRGKKMYKLTIREQSCASIEPYGYIFYALSVR